MIRDCDARTLEPPFCELLLGELLLCVPVFCGLAKFTWPWLDVPLPVAPLFDVP